MIRAAAKQQVTVRLDRGQLARARRLLGAKTVTQAIGDALDFVTEKLVHDSVIRKYSGIGGRRAFGRR